MTRPRAVVVGAGIGGLAAALDLVNRGLAVTVLEHAAQPGGKMREVEIQDHRIDSGPTVLTMPWVFEELFADAGSDLGEHLELRPADLLARHAWQDDREQLDLFADREQSVAAIEAFAGRNEAQGYRAFCAHAERVFNTLYGPFIRSQRPGPGALVRAAGLRGLADLWNIRPFESLWHGLGKYFNDSRLRSLFARYATYCGSSPLQAPATLMLIAHVEQCGVWQVDGGMQRLAEAIAGLVMRKGGEIHYDSKVTELDMRSGRAVGVTLSTGQSIVADVVVANADVAGIRCGALGRAAALAVPETRPSRRSLSALTWSMLAETSGFELAHHNVFFPDDYPREFNDIFGQARLPVRPAVYICAQDRKPGDSRPVGPERLFLIVNAPPCSDRSRFAADDIEPVRTAAFKLLNNCGLTIDARADQTVVTTPTDFERRFPGTGGALYGTAAHGWRSSFTRPGARSRIRGLYLAGGSVHPGPGVPMVALSGRLAAEAVAADLGLGPRR